MDAYQAKALGREPEADPAAAHKIGTIGVFALIVAAIILDVISIFEVPVADIIAWIIEIPLLLYFWYTGASQLRQIAANLLAWTAELIPVIDILPLYLVGMLLVILFDRNETLARIASKIPNTKLPTGKLSTGGGKAGSNLAKNRMFGAASEQRIAQATKVGKDIEQLREKVPGKLRSAIPHRDGVENMRSAGFVRPSLPPRPNISPSYQGVAPASTPEENPLIPDYDREFLPELPDIMGVDVTGEQVVAPKNPSVGIPQPKKVQ